MSTERFKQCEVLAKQLLAQTYNKFNLMLIRENLTIDEKVQRILTLAKNEISRKINIAVREERNLNI
jgi:hypothetical protein